LEEVFIQIQEHLKRCLFHKMERIKDFLLLEEVFIQIHERLKNEETHEEKNEAMTRNLLLYYSESESLYIFPVHV
jgi:hypothetical protein